jgi:excisionase family DNA binding protein
MTIVVLTPDELEVLLERAVRKALQLQGAGEALSTGEAGRLARRSPKTIRRWVASNQLVATRRDRQLLIRRSDLEAYLAGRREGVSTAAVVASLSK